ncbi:MAG: hypothetical protein OEM32_11020, partial [Acidimicrobiia bacterium]|nr:hypothetical protein [Acidimicrobiia bacterium]
MVAKAPGIPEGSVFAGFENNESVSMFNGNLVVTHASSPTLPIDGGRTIGLTRTYNSKNVQVERVMQDCDGVRYHFMNGKSWAGLGWTTHRGRIFQKSVYCACATTYADPDYHSRQT